MENEIDTFERTFLFLSLTSGAEVSQYVMLFLSYQCFEHSYFSYGRPKLRVGLMIVM